MEQLADSRLSERLSKLKQNQIEQESYPVAEVNKPIKEIRNGVEVIYRTRGSRGGRYKSYIWKYFREQEEEVDGGTLRYVECVFCNNRASPKAGRMEKHLQSCEFCPAGILENELGLGSGQTDLKSSGRSLQNTISSTMEGEDDGGGIETDIIDDGIMEDDDGGNQSNQDQEASSSSGCQRTNNNGAGSTGLKKRRTFHWKRIATYRNIEEAELALGDLSMWSRKHKHRTQQGIKTYYGCKFGRNCPVQMHLLFEARTKRVIMFQTMEEHCHISKFKKRGLPHSAEKPIRQLYSEGVTKPSHIQQVLDEDGEVDVPPRYQIAYFLDKIRKEDGGSGQSSVPSPPPQVKTENSGGETITIPGDLMSNWYDESNDNLNGEEDSGEIEILPFFGESEGSMDDGSNQNWMTEFPMVTPTSTSSGPASTNPLKSGQGNSSYSQGNSLQTSSDGLSSITVTEVHGSVSLPSQFAFRDETTEDGDIIAPGEQNVKKRVISFIEKNFSNRDFLQIHKELQSLKDAHKFTSLIRLASFTSGFLQTAFLDQQQDAK